jgi:hypothetical protein
VSAHQGPGLQRGMGGGRSAPGASAEAALSHGGADGHSGRRRSVVLAAARPVAAPADTLTFGTAPADRCG